MVRTWDIRGKKNIDQMEEKKSKLIRPKKKKKQHKGRQRGIKEKKK